MANNMTIEQARNLAPARMRERMAAGTATNRNFAEGVRDAYPMLSIKGKTFSVRAEGQTQIVRDGATGRAAQVLDVVLINASRALAKTYYINAFDDNAEYVPPDCFSLDSVRPDASSRAIQNPTCQDCRWNVFGSAPSRDPSVKRAGKACQDFRRVVVTLPHLLTMPQAHLMMVRIPATSLKNMKAYVDKLAANGYEPGGCVTRLLFDEKEAYPKLEFQFVGPVSDEEYDRILELSTGPEQAAMLQAPDFDNTMSPGQDHTVQRVETPRAGVRQAPPDMGPGFGPGMVKEPEPTLSQPVHAAPMPTQTVTYPEPVQVRQPEPVAEAWDDLGDGTEINPETGEVRTKRDPNASFLIKTSDGRLYNKLTKKFVEMEQPAQPEKKPAKKAAPKKAAEPKPEPQPVQEAAPVASNGHVEEDEPEQDQPIIVQASPRLEALLGGLASKRDDK